MSETVAATVGVRTIEEGNYWLALVAAQKTIARAFECGVPDCDKTSHEGGEAPAEWTHRVYYSIENGLEVEINRNADGTHKAWFAVEYIDDADSKDLREMASSLNAFALQLVTAAARLDELNKAGI